MLVTGINLKRISAKPREREPLTLAFRPPITTGYRFSTSGGCAGMLRVVTFIEAGNGLSTGFPFAR
jgi:hypothetical protein